MIGEFRCSPNLRPRNLGFASVGSSQIESQELARKTPEILLASARMGILFAGVSQLRLLQRIHLLLPGLPQLYRATPAAQTIPSHRFYQILGPWQGYEILTEPVQKLFVRPAPGESNLFLTPVAAIPLRNDQTPRPVTHAVESSAKGVQGRWKGYFFTQKVWCQFLWFLVFQGFPCPPIQDEQQTGAQTYP